MLKVKILNRIFKNKINKIYIMPTKNGLYFVGLIIFMLLVSILYNNNLIYLVTFILFSILIISLIFTHYNLLNVKAHVKRVESNFVDNNVYADIYLINSSNKEKNNITMELYDLDARSELKSNCYLLSNNSTYVGMIPIPVKRRGVFNFSEILLYTTYPFGFFKSWSFQEIDLKYYGYPKPIGMKNFLSNKYDVLDLESGEEKGGDDFSGHKDYESSDPLRHIDWKIFARTNDLMIKKFNGGGGGKIVFDWDDLPRELDIESKLSQLSLWVVRANSLMIPYILNLPNRRVDNFGKKNFYEECLISLAEYNERQ